MFTYHNMVNEFQKSFIHIHSAIKKKKKKIIQKYIRKPYQMTLKAPFKADTYSVTVN